RAVKPRFREGEIVGIHGSGVEGVVDDVAGPDDDGLGWAVQVWVEQPERGRTIWVVAETDLRPTGYAEGPDGERLPLNAVPPAAERRTLMQLRVVTSVTESSVAAEVAENIEESVRDLVGHCRIAIEAERHWA